MGERAYLDHNATTPLRPAAAEAMTRALQIVGNPSSIHAEGRAARAALDRARHQVAAAVGGRARDVIFTSGATEALATLLRLSPAIVGPSGAAPFVRFIRPDVEHSAVLAACNPGGLGAPNDGDGVVRLDAMEALLAQPGAAIVALQAANGETGVLQPVAAAAAMARAAGALAVCDAVAAFGKIPLDIVALGVDALVVSAHKIGGPKGVGAIILNGERLVIAEPLIGGGGQEMRRRSGTENVAGIVGMGAAADEAAAAIESEANRLAALRDRLLDGLLSVRPDIVVFGAGAPRLPNTLNIGVPGLRSETAVIALDLAGVAVSSGSACSSGKVRRSHVLDAMGVAPALAEGALRFSLGWTTNEADIAKAVTAFAAIAGGAASRAA